LALRLLTSWTIRTQQQQEQPSAEERELMMNLSSAYLEWEQKTRQEGLQQGRQQGRQEGLQVGLQQGLQVGERRMLLRLLTERFGPLPQTLIDRIEAISEDSRLEELAKALLSTQDLQSFEQLL
jgi:flagellar biosynthesis/type III secretory pathway protein FliH